MKKRRFDIFILILSSMVSILIIANAIKDGFTIVGVYNTQEIVKRSNEKSALKERIKNQNKEYSEQEAFLQTNTTIFSDITKENNEVLEICLKYEDELKNLPVYNEKLVNIYNYYQDLFHLQDITIGSNYDFDSAKNLSNKNKIVNTASSLFGNWFSDMVVAKDNEKDNRASTALINYNNTVSPYLVDAMDFVGDIIQIQKELEFFISLTEVEETSEDAYVNLKIIEYYFGGEPNLEIYEEKLGLIMDNVGELYKLMDIIYNHYSGILLNSDNNAKYLSNMSRNMDSLIETMDSYSNKSMDSINISNEIQLNISMAYKELIDIYCGEPLHLALDDLEDYSIRVYSKDNSVMNPLAVYKKNFNNEILYICERDDRMGVIRRYYFDFSGQLVCMELVSCNESIYLNNGEVLKSNVDNTGYCIAFANELKSKFFNTDFEDYYEKMSFNYK